jgi:non-canonical poly(A) RNA polymerase PAPD5/7
VSLHVISTSVNARLTTSGNGFAANDISRGSFGIAKVRTTLAGAYGILSATTYLRAGVLEARREGRLFKLRHKYHSEELSILSTVVGVTLEVCDPVS